MPARHVRVVTLLLSLAAVALVVAGCSAAKAAPAAPGPSVGEQLDAPLPATVRDAPLISSAAQNLDLAALAGKVVVVSDMMTLCQETCPLDTANLVAAARVVEQAGLGSKVEFVSITIDPTRDDPTRLAAFRRLYAPAPADWMVLTGAPPSLSLLWQALGVYIQKVPDTSPAPRDWLTGKPLSYDLTHSDETFFVDPRGHERFLLEGAPHVAPGAPIPPTLLHFMDATGHANLTHPDPQAWTLPQALQVLSWLTGQHIADSAADSATSG